MFMQKLFEVVWAIEDLIKRKAESEDERLMMHRLACQAVEAGVEYLKQGGMPTMPTIY